MIAIILPICVPLSGSSSVKNSGWYLGDLPYSFSCLSESLKIKIPKNIGIGNRTHHPERPISCKRRTIAPRVGKKVIIKGISSGLGPPLLELPNFIYKRGFKD